MLIDEPDDDHDSSPTKRYSSKPANNPKKEKGKSLNPSAMSSLS